MSIFTKVVKGIFGDKSAKDKKLIWPIVEEINQFQDTLSSKSDDDLKQNYIDLKNELSNLIKDTKIKLESNLNQTRTKLERIYDSTCQGTHEDNSKVSFS